VKSLGVLQTTAGHQPLPQDFHFNEDIFDLASQTSQSSHFDLDFSSYDFKPVLTGTSSPESHIARIPSLTSNADSLSSASSRAQSEIPLTHATSLSPFSSGPKDINGDSMLAEVMPQKALRPRHCPMPPRVDTMPVKPTPLDAPTPLDIPMHNTPEALAYETTFMPVEPHSWQMNNEMMYNPGLMMTPGQLMMNYSNMPAPIADASWDAWIDMTPTYVHFYLLSGHVPVLRQCRALCIFQKERWSYLDCVSVYAHHKRISSS
jgi:hypothetical protein